MDFQETPTSSRKVNFPGFLKDFRKMSLQKVYSQKGKRIKWPSKNWRISHQNPKASLTDRVKNVKIPRKTIGIVLNYDWVLFTSFIVSPSRKLCDVDQLIWVRNSKISKNYQIYTYSRLKSLIFWLWVKNHFP